MLRAISPGTGVAGLWETLEEQGVCRLVSGPLSSLDMARSLKEQSALGRFGLNIRGSRLPFLPPACFQLFPTSKGLKDCGLLQELKSRRVFMVDPKA